MSSSPVITKAVPASTTFGLKAVAVRATPDDIGPVINAMYPKINEAMQRAGVEPVGASVAYYRPAPEESDDAVWVHATFPLPVDELAGLERIEIPAAQVASLIHEGSVDGLDAAHQTLYRWAHDNGHTPTGEAREIYLETPDDQTAWVTEVQLDITP